MLKIDIEAEPPTRKIIYLARRKNCSVGFWGWILMPLTLPFFACAVAMLEHPIKAGVAGLCVLLFIMFVTGLAVLQRREKLLARTSRIEKEEAELCDSSHQDDVVRTYFQKVLEQDRRPIRLELIAAKVYLRDIQSHKQLSARTNESYSAI